MEYDPWLGNDQLNWGYGWHGQSKHQSGRRKATCSLCDIWFGEGFATNSHNKTKEEG